MNEPKFKVGQKVKVVDYGWGVALEDVGKETTITGYKGLNYNGEHHVYFFDTSNFDFAHYSDNDAYELSFEAVEDVA